MNPTTPTDTQHLRELLAEPIQRYDLKEFKPGPSHLFMSTPNQPTPPPGTPADVPPVSAEKAFLEAAITEQIEQAKHWVEHYDTDAKGAMDRAFWEGRETAWQEALHLIQSLQSPGERTELLPCPFCGSAVAKLKDGIHCQHPPGDCWASGYQFTIPEWNTRA